jgi:hypothetical protein
MRRSPDSPRALEQFWNSKRVTELSFLDDGQRAIHLNCMTLVKVMGLKQPEGYRQVAKVKLWCEGCSSPIEISVSEFESRRK